MEKRYSKRESHIYSVLSELFEELSLSYDFKLGVNYSDFYRNSNPLKYNLDSNTICKLYYANKMLYDCFCYSENYNQAYNLLADEYSKSIFDWVLQYKITYAFNEKLAQAKYVKPDVVYDNNMIAPLGGSCFEVNKYHIHSTYKSIYESWILQEYYHEKCSVSPSDIVISGGAFRGESSIWFASQVFSGRVYAFEPSKLSYSLLCDNIRDNNLEDRIIPINSALSAGDKPLYFNSGGTELEGAGSICLPSKADYEVKSISIDSFVKEQRLDRIDFIKLDIEGFELEALKGAVHTLRSYTPKLAICLYHKPEDIFSIPLYLDSLKLGYTFYMAQNVYNNSIVDCWYHTMLFAVPPYFLDKR